MVLDASVVINLNATMHTPEILGAFPGKFVVTENAVAELAYGIQNGHDDARQLQHLIIRGIVEFVYLGDAGLTIYESLIDGGAISTLDDGEAATIAYACEVGGVAVIDERKARRLCIELFPSLSVLSTTDLLLDDAVIAALGPEEHVESIYRALTVARMRVPAEKISAVIKLIGEERAATCTCLPRTARIGS